MRLSFRNRLALFLVAVLAAVQFLTAAAVYSVTRGALIEQGKAELGDAASLFARQLDARAARLAEGVQVLALDFALRQAIALKDRETALSALRNHGRRIGATRMVLIGLDGTMEADTEETGGLTGTFPFPALLDGAAEGDQAKATGMAALGNGIYWMVVVPVLAPTPVAFIGVGIPVDDALLDEMRRIADLPESLVLATAGSDDRWTAVARAQGSGDDHLLSAAHRAMAGPVVAEHDGAEILVLARPLATAEGSTPVLAVLEFPLAEALRPYRAVLVAALALFGVGLTVALLGTVAIARSVTRPVEALAAAARRIEQGDYAPPPPLPQRDEIGQLSTALGSMARAIGEREQQIRFQATHDATTGLANRAGLEQRLGPEMAAGALLLVGLERAQEIVNTLGHALGDRVMADAGRRLMALAPGACTVARTGDTRLALWLPGAGAEEADTLARTIRAAFETPYREEDLSVDCGAAVGSALCPDHGATAAELLQHADVALFAAQRLEARVARYDPATDPHRPERLSLMGDLREALERDELKLFYQPKLDLASGRIVGAEALVRWTHARRGFIPPDAFIPLAEETGAITRLTRWAVRTGIHRIADWHGQGLAQRAAVNLSARDLSDATLPDQVADLLAEYGVAPRNLILEVTESAIMGDPDAALAVLNRLAGLGLDLAVDDFGVGQSSLAYLRRLPVRELKIDRSFITHLATDPHDRTIARTIVELGHGLGCTVTAEGVEDAATLEHLTAMGCDTAQGYFIARPLPPDAFAAFLAEGRFPAKRLEVA